MYLAELIAWLEQQDKEAVVKDGFGSPHTDRGDYHDLAFDPAETTTFGEMLEKARISVGATFMGWKGGDFTMSGYSTVKIGEFGVTGEHITSAHLKLWLLTAEKPAKAAKPRSRK